MSLYDRFYLGFPISRSEYDKLWKLYTDILYGDKKEGKVKALINKL